MTRLSITSKLATEPSGELLTWDTEFWKQRIGRATTSDIDAWAKANTVGCVCLLVSADEPERIQEAEARGFRSMDVRVTLGRKPTLTPSRTFRAAPSDLGALVAIARESHRITRFYADPRFPDERCDDLYETWIRSSVAGWADQVLVATQDGAAVGYVTIHLAEEVGSIGLIAVAEAERGKGLGRELVQGAINYCHLRGAGRITVVTQGRNVAALRLFERCGFLVESSEVWLHKWYEQTA